MSCFRWFVIRSGRFQLEDEGEEGGLLDRVAGRIVTVHPGEFALSGSAGRLALLSYFVGDGFSVA